MKFKLTLRDLFGLVLVCAVGCALVLNSQHRLMSNFLDVAIHLSLVVAAGVVAGRYLSKAPFVAGFALGLIISICLIELRQASLVYLLRNLVIPHGTTNVGYVVSAALRSFALASGILGGAIATAISRMRKES